MEKQIVGNIVFTVHQNYELEKVRVTWSNCFV